MATGFVSNSGVEPIDALFTRGGMASLLTTIWLVLGALSFAAVMEHAGFLQRLLQPIVSRTRRRGSLILAVNSSGVGLNVIAGDQYVADVLPARMFRGEFSKRGLAPQVLSRAVEDSGTVTSVLVPWNTCGAYISGVLGVSTAAYFPFCFFNLLSPDPGRPLRIHRVQGTDGESPVERPRTWTGHGAEPPATTRGGDHMSQETASAEPEESPRLHPAVGVHHPVRADRPDGDRHLAHPGGRLPARQGRRADPRAPTRRWPATRSGS